MDDDSLYDTQGERPVYVISVAAELASLHPQTLRIYERKGLLDPNRTIGGNRRYSAEDIERLKHIQNLTRSGINLEGVRKILELEDKIAKLQKELEHVNLNSEIHIKEIHRQYRRDLVPIKGERLPIRRLSQSKELLLLLEIWTKHSGKSHYIN